ncbi:HNH endonuclease [Georgenia soli]|uniref:HNH endonuclease n=1 Tax=Georgenia soli TaxID=638953 RepID=UPI00117B6032|nr:HNH endonuclease [Georgenia soli]
MEAAHLDGYGPITPDIARALAAGGTWRRLITDPLSGVVTDLGRTRYRPPAALQDLVRARDTTCVRPACTVPARRAQIDHTKAWSAGGTTALHQLGSMCNRDHTTKTVGAFHVTQPEPGIFVWTTPSGHTYRRETNGTTTLIAIGPPLHSVPEPLHDHDDPPPF